jgi:thiol-disulfide isomerase/thioredoxin
MKRVIEAHISEMNAMALPTLVLSPILLFQLLATTVVASSYREPAPNFVATTLDGQRFTNDSLKGKAVLIEFWATWCRFCRHDEQLVDSLPSETDSARLMILAVNVNESRGTVRAYLARFPRASKIVLKEDTDLVAMYAPRSLPLYVLIDRAGNIMAIRRGALNDQALRSLVNTIKDDLRQDDLTCCVR